MPVGDRDRYIHLKEISVHFIKRRPKSVLDLVFTGKCDAGGVEYKSNKFKLCDLVHWDFDMYVRTYTNATLIIRGAHSNMRVAEISVKFKPNKFRDGRVVALQDSNHLVTVNFMCGRSQSLADVICALDSQTRTTALASKVPGSLKLLQLVARPLPTSEQEYNAQCVTIHCLNDDILFGIFNCYRLADEIRWNVQLEWRKLSQVCQRWRSVIYEYAFHLGMHIKCTNGTPIVDTLDHIPPLPLLVDYRYTSGLTGQDELGICHALWSHDRVRYLYLDLRPSILHKCLVLMVEHFPILEDLTLRSMRDSFTALTLSKTFLAPNLRRLSLSGISLPKRLRLLSSTISLVALDLWDIQASSYFRPKLIVARLRSLPQLEELRIGFSVPIPHPSTERELLGEQGTPVTLPNLNTLKFKGVSVYLESFIAQIRAPVLKRLEITLFNQIAFTLQHLSHFINITEGLKIPVVRVAFWGDTICVTTSSNLLYFDGPFFIEVKCKPLDWQIDCAAQICTALAPVLLASNVGQFILDVSNFITPNKWLDYEIDDATWHELLRSFVGMRELRIETRLLEELARVLQMDELGLDPGFLPDLQEIVAERNLFASFIDTRQVVGRPVRFSPLS